MPWLCPRGTTSTQDTYKSYFNSTSTQEWKHNFKSTIIYKEIKTVALFQVWKACLFDVFIYSLFTVDKFTIKTDTIMYTNKNSYVLIIKKHTNSCQLPN